MFFSGCRCCKRCDMVAQKALCAVLSFVWFTCFCLFSYVLLVVLFVSRAFDCAQDELLRPIFGGAAVVPRLVQMYP